MPTSLVIQLRKLLVSKPLVRHSLNQGLIWLDDRGTGQWKWLEEVPRRSSLAPLASPCLVLCLLRLETEGLLDYQGRAGIISIGVNWRAQLDKKLRWPDSLDYLIRRFTHQRFPEWSWRSFRRNWWRTSGEVWKEIFELLLLGKIVRSIFHQNSTANFTIKLHYEVLGCGGPYRFARIRQSSQGSWASRAGRRGGVSNRGGLTIWTCHSLRIYPYPMVWDHGLNPPLITEKKTLEIKGILGLERPFLDLVSQTPRPRGRGRPLFAQLVLSFFLFKIFGTFPIFPDCPDFFGDIRWPQAVAYVNA